MHLSLSGFLFEDNYKTQSLPFGRFCALAQSLGYAAVELRRTQITPSASEQDRREILGAARDHGLYISCLTARGMPADGPQREDFLAQYLELCRDVECGLLKIGGEPAWLHRAAQQASEYGVVLASNNHVGGQLETVAGTLAQLHEVSHPNYRLLFDSLHLQVSGEDYIGSIPALHPFTHNILVQSLRPAREGEKIYLGHQGREWTKALLDEPGTQDWAAILQAYKALSYDGLITVIENGWPVERRELVARHSAEVLRKLWG